MSGVRRVTVGLAVAALAAIAVGALPASAGPDASLEQNQSDQRRVPEAIRVPEGNKRIAFMPARGVQTYQCVGGAWTFLQLDAILEHRGRAEVLHSRGPVWTSVTDGSSVTAAAQRNSPVPGAIPYVQRLNTTGGVSPTGSCTEGVTASVPYTADYAFWVKR